MRSTKIELHCHTSEVSLCGRMTAEEVVEAYIQKGYSGIVITDHFTSGLFNNDEGLEETLFKYYSGYRNALIAAKGRIKIYRGAELRLNENINDYLIFGDSSNLLRKGKDLFNYDIKKLYESIKAEGLAIYQAHPNRDHMKQMPVEYLDGIEVYNLHTGHNSRNYLSVAFAQENGIKGISGSDAHQLIHVGRGGILTENVPKTETELKDILLSGNYDLIF